MQKLLFILAFFYAQFYSVNAQKEKLDLLFDKYQDANGVTSIKISKPMFSMLNKLNIDDAELSQIKPLLAKINGLKILIVEKPTFPKGLAAENVLPLERYESLKKDISASIKNMNYEELMTVNSKDNKIKFLSSDVTNGNLDNLLLSINSEDNAVLMMLDGKLSMDDVNNLINETEKSSNKITNDTSGSTTGGSIRSVGSFTGIEVSSGIKVNFTQQKNQLVKVDVDDDKAQYLITEVQNGILKIYIKNNGQKNLRFRKLFVNIEAPHLTNVATKSGASFATLNQISEEGFVMNAASGSSLNAELKGDNISAIVESGASMKLEVQTRNFTFGGSSGSSAVITGNTNVASFQTSSAASCNAQNLIAKNVSANASSAGSLRVNTSNSLSSVTSSGGTVKYVGQPEKFAASNSSGGSTKPIN